MVRTEHDIVSQVQSAKTDSEAADALIRQYMGFIRSETVKFLHTAPENGHEDELSIAMLAFYEAVLAYERNRGAFLPYAARAIKNRLIDHYRTEKRHGNVISLHTPLGGEEDGGELLDTIPDTVDHAEDYAVRTASRREIQEFSEKLAQFGLTFLDADVLYRAFSTLSNGERTKVMLAVLFSRENQFLLIDEPTNHLDQEGRASVREYLKGKKGFILVSHDRDFLDQCVDHVLVINRTNIEVYKGNFSVWWEEKQRKDAWEQAENERLKQDIRRLESSARVKEQWADALEARKLGKKAAAEAQKKRKHHKRKTAADWRKVKKNAAAEKESGTPSGAGYRGEGRPFKKSGDHRGFETVSAPPSQRDIGKPVGGPYLL